MAEQRTGDTQEGVFHVELFAHLRLLPCLAGASCSLHTLLNYRTRLEHYICCSVGTVCAFPAAGGMGGSTTAGGSTAAGGSGTAGASSGTAPAACDATVAKAGACYLVRPDGIIAFRSKEADAEALHEYLAKWYHWS